MDTTTKIHTTDDSDIRQSVESEFAWRPEVEPGQIGVSVKDHVVTLTGEVQSVSQRIAAIEAAQRVRGVSTIDDQLHLPEHGDEPTDGQLAVAVDKVLGWTETVPHGTVKAEVQGHTVILTGTVDWNYQRVAAKKAIERLASVHHVDSRIELTRRPTADGISEEVTNALIRNAVLGAAAITVTVNRDEVTLTGTVHSWAEKNHAAATVWASPHVGVVYTNLVVG